MDLKRLNGTPLENNELEGRVLLYVNVASYCGNTKQYTALQSLYEEKKDDGLVIIGVPCNQFGKQEPDSPVEIERFCSTNYNVTFPLLEKQDVNGSNRSELYQQLVQNGDDIAWNFEKFLVDRTGQVVGRFSPSTQPDNSDLRNAIENALQG